MKNKPEAEADQQRMRGQRRGAVDIAGAERTRNRRGHAAAHGAARHGHGQDHDREHQRHRGQQFHAQAGRYRRSRRSRRRCRRSARSRSARPATAACAGSGRRPTRSSTALPAAEAGVPSRRREFRQRRDRTFLLPARGFGSTARCFLARRGAIPRAPGAMGACGIVLQGRAPPPPLEREARPGGHFTGNSCRPHERLGRHRIGMATPQGTPSCASTSSWP